MDDNGSRAICQEAKENDGWKRVIQWRQSIVDRAEVHVRGKIIRIEMD